MVLRSATAALEARISGQGGLRNEWLTKRPCSSSAGLADLFPACPAAEKALAAVTGRVRVKITRTQGNNKRIALYWIVLGIAAPMLDEVAPGITDELLHNILEGPLRPGPHRQAAERRRGQGLRLASASTQ
jgi:hypothetical protein